MLVGYMRVSKADGSQTTDPQRDALVEAGVDDERLYEDRASGRRDDRPGLAECLKSLRAGDTLVVWKLDRLGRDLHHLVNAVHDDAGEGAARDGFDGQARHQGRRALQGARDLPTDPLPARCTERRATAR